MIRLRFHGITSWRGRLAPVLVHDAILQKPSPVHRHAAVAAPGEERSPVAPNMAIAFPHGYVSGHCWMRFLHEGGTKMGIIPDSVFLTIEVSLK